MRTTIRDRVLRGDRRAVLRRCRERLDVCAKSVLLGDHGADLSPTVSISMRPRPIASATLRSEHAATIWDRLSEAGLTAATIFRRALPRIVGVKYLPISRPYQSFLLALPRAGSRTSPSLTRALSRKTGTTNDDHPHADIRNGQAFMMRCTAVTTSPAEEDSSGDHYDRVGRLLRARPACGGPAIPLPLKRPGTLTGSALSGPLSRDLAVRRASVVAHDVFDHTSVLRSSSGDGARTFDDARCTANNLARRWISAAGGARRAVRRAAGPFGAPCPSSSEPTSEWIVVRDIARGLVFPV